MESKMKYTDAQSDVIIIQKIFALLAYFPRIFEVGNNLLGSQISSSVNSSTFNSDYHENKK